VVVTDEETVACISDVYARSGYVLDPHTAVGVRAYERAAEREAGTTVVLATAHPAKFPEVVERAIGRQVPLPPGIAKGMTAKEQMQHIGSNLEALRAVLDG
jgi:threonine synthase